MGRIEFSVFKAAVARAGERARLVARIAAFEIGRQTRQPLYWIAAALFFGFSVSLMSAHGLLGSPVMARNAPSELVKAVLIEVIFYLAVIVAMAGDAALRDARSGFEPILRATPVARAEHLVGRWIGAQIAAGSAFLLGLTGLVAGAWAPWVDKAAVGPFDWGLVALVVAVVAVPTCAILTSLCFALAAGLRSVTAVYVAVIGLWVAAIMSSDLLFRLEDRVLWLAGLIEPIGLLAYRYDIIGLDPSVLAAHPLPLKGLFALNRLMGVVSSTGLLGLALLAERREDAAQLRRAPGSSAGPPPLSAWPRVTPRFGAGARLAQLRARLNWELRMLLRSPSLLILIALSAAMSFADLWTAGKIGGVPSLPATRILATSMTSWFMMMSMIVATFYAGEIVWRDRDRRAAEMIDVTPVPDAVLMAAKVMALVVLVLLIGAVGVLAATGVQFAKGYVDGRPDLYWRMMVLPIGGPMIVLAAGSVAVAALAPNRYAGWAVTGLVIAACLAASQYGISHPLLTFLESPSSPLSEMNPAGDGTGAEAWVGVYWALWMGVALLGAWLVWPRGRPAPWRASRDQAVRRLRGAGGWVAGGLALGLLAIGGFCFLNIDIWNTYVTKPAAEAATADWERQVARYVGLPEPTVMAVTMRVDLEPRGPRLRVSGSYVLENRTGRPLSEIHVDMPGQLTDWTLDVAGARKVSSQYGLAVMRFERPMASGERRTLRFTSRIAPRGFGQNGGQTQIVENGSFLPSWGFAPSLGARSENFLTDADARRRQGLPPERAELEPTDPRAVRANYVHSDWVTSDITVVTDADQTPIAPGRRVSDHVAGGRRTARFVADRPILNAFSIQSARYAVRRAQHGPVTIEVYYHPTHGTNVGRMIKAVEGGLDVYQKAFGPYPLDYLRIVEFPAYGDYAQAFAGTIPFSENAGFVSDVRDPKTFDIVSNITLHELAHQWWAHQVVGADAKGARLLSEGLAEYSAIMAQGRLQGFLAPNQAIENDSQIYRQGRGERRGPEQSLVRVTDQDFVTYQRAALVLIRARAVMGEGALNAALRDFLNAYRFRGAPYPTSETLMAALKARASPEDWRTLEPLFRGTGEVGYVLFLPNEMPEASKGKGAKAKSATSGAPKAPR